MRTTTLLALVLCSVGIAQAAAVKNPDPATGMSKDACVFVNNISGWRVLDSRHVVLFTPNEKRAYLVQLGMPVSDLKFAFQVAFVDRDRDGQLCGRSSDRILAVDSLVRQPSNIMGMTRLDEAGLQALETQYNVKLTRKKDDKASDQAT